MELMTLAEDFQPEYLIENYESLIWTERYSSAGDFELKSTDISAAINALPKESFVTLRESTVPMMVEDHKIQKTPRGAPSITITGRSFDSVLERRASVNKLPSGTARASWMMAAAKESDAAYQAMRIVLGDSARVYTGTEILPLLAPAVSALDAIPEIDLILPADYEVILWSSTVTYSEHDVVYYSGSIYKASSLAGNLNKTPDSQPTYWSVVSSPGSFTTAASKTYEIKPANLYNTVMDLVKTNHRGLKAIRPSVGETKVSIEIYNGADLTNDVVFDARFDQFDDTTYLLSERGSMNVAYVFGSNGSQSVLKTSAPEPSGLSRRVLLLDQTSDTTTNTSDIRNTRGLIELYKYNATALFDGQIAAQIAAGYNTVYHLGDILKLTGEYGLSQNVRVEEFIRTSDKTGDKAYPAFSSVESI